jgi:hypothetical protein
MISVSKPINGITLNGDEYLLTKTGEVMLFNGVIEAVEYLKEQGLEKDEINKFNFKKEETI